jgi:pimeloyl-ACP methyl ester carboxylesterase
MLAQSKPNVFLEYDRAGQGTPVLLLHAFPLSHSMWRPQIDALQGQYDVIAPDFRGFGGSSPFSDAPSVEHMADDAFALLEVLGVQQKVVLVGLSMGGYVALAATAKHHDRLQGLVLADTRAEADDPTAKANRDKLIEFARSHSATDVIEQLLPKLLADQTRQLKPDVVADVRRIAAEQSLEGVIGALKALRDRPDASAGLGSIRVPTLVIVGEKDAITPPNMAETLRAGIRGAQLVNIPGAGHLSNLENPAAFNEALLTFLASLRR